jgi:hypothetical protein
MPQVENYNKNNRGTAVSLFPTLYDGRLGRNMFELVLTNFKWFLTNCVARETVSNKNN